MQNKLECGFLASETSTTTLAMPESLSWSVSSVMLTESKISKRYNRALATFEA